MHRASLKNASRIVVKLGTGVLTDSRKRPDLEQIRQLAAQIAAVRAEGKQVVIVSSGAVGRAWAFWALRNGPPTSPSYRPAPPLDSRA